MSAMSSLFPDRPVVGLAPMAGVTDAVFRRICQDMGADLTVTEMVSAQGLFYNPERSSSLMELFPGEERVCLQLFGRMPEVVADMAEKYQEPYFSIDINMGCPAPKITKAGQGSALLREPELAREIVHTIVSRVKKPVSVKMRLGWEDASGAVDFAKRMEDAGASFLTVHGRTREQQYSGAADWDAIAAINEAVSIPVLANGDVFSAEDAKAALSITGCAGVMIGRGSQGNPWLFSRIRDALEGREPHEPTRQEIASVALRHAREMCAWRGERWAVPLLRKHIAWYIRGIPGGAAWRIACYGAEHLADFESIMERFSQDSGNFSPESAAKS